MFEEYLSPNKGVSDHIRFRQDGGVYISARLTSKYFKGFNRVSLAFDKHNKVIRITPTKETRSSLGSILALGKPCHAQQFSGMGFIKHFNIMYIMGKRYKPIWDDKDKSLKINIGEKKDEF